MATSTKRGKRKVSQQPRLTDITEDLETEELEEVKVSPGVQKLVDQKVKVQFQAQQKALQNLIADKIGTFTTKSNENFSLITELAQKVQTLSQNSIKKIEDKNAQLSRLTDAKIDQYHEMIDNFVKAKDVYESRSA